MSLKSLSQKFEDSFEDPKTLKALGIKVRKSRNDKQKQNINTTRKRYLKEQAFKRMMWDGLGSKPGTHS